MKMRNILILLATMVILAYGVYSATTCTMSDVTYASGNYNFSLTVSGHTASWNTTNMSIAVTGCGTGSCTELNGNNKTVWNCTIATTSFSDDTQCTSTGIIYNVTGGTATCTDTFYPDNTVPVCTITSHSSGSVYASDGTWQVTASNASSCTIQFGGNIVESMTESSDVCTFSKRQPEGHYNVQVTNSDGRNSTSCTSVDIELNNDGVKPIWIPYQYEQEQQKQKTNAWVYAGLAILAYLYLNRKK